MSFNRNRSPKALGTPFAGPSGKPWVVQAPPGVITLIASTVTVFFRQHFGEQYLNPFTLVEGSFFLGIYAIAMRIFAGRGRIDSAMPVPASSWIAWLIFAALFFICVSWHLFSALRRRKRFPDELSYSDGRPREFLFRFMPLLRNEWDFECYFEPAIILALGSLLIYFHNWFGWYLVIAAVCARSVARDKYYIRCELDRNSLDARTQASTQPDFDSPADEETANSATFSANDDKSRKGS